MSKSLKALLACALLVAVSTTPRAQTTARAQTHVQSLAVTTDGAIWAGTFGDGLLLSRDDGASFTDAKLPEGAGRRILAVVTDGGRVAIGTEATGLWILDGAAWRQASEIPATASVEALTRAGDGTWWAGTWDDGLFRSADGKTWMPVPSWTAPGSPSVIQSIAGVLLVGTTGDGLYRSTNDGTSWIKLATIPERANIAALEPAAGGVFLAVAAEGDVFRSDDRGASWRGLGRCVEEGGGFYQLSVADASRWLVSTSKGIASSSDGGATWSQPNPPGTTTGAILIKDERGDVRSIHVAVPVDEGERPAAVTAR